MIKFVPEMPLYTKDGRVIGNAKIVKELRKYVNHLIMGSTTLYLIKTDYGNFAKLTVEEINAQFYFLRSEENQQYINELKDFSNECSYKETKE